MANVSYMSGSWVSAGPAHDLAPGRSHSWISWGFGYGDALSVSAHPVVGAPVGERILAVENVRVEGDPSGRRLYYTVRNAGPTSVPGYALAVAWVSQ